MPPLNSFRSAPAPASEPSETRAVAIVLFVALLAQLPLIFNPGYFSHDELQWAAWSDAGIGRSSLWEMFDRTGDFQYRPLTFTLWLALSRCCFATPPLFHAVAVALGSINAALLLLLMRRLGVRPWPSIFAALVFALSPYAAIVHGWVGCLADLIWLGCALCVALIATMSDRALIITGVAAVFTALGLLAKEAALTIPALFGVAWILDARRRRWLAAAFGSGTVGVAYLGLRFDALLHAPRAGSSYYAPALANVPMRWIEYQIYPLLPTIPEVGLTFVSGTTALVASALALWGMMLIALWQARPRLAAWFLAGGTASLLPMLPLGGSSNQYGYAYAAVTAATIAAAWPAAGRWGRACFTTAAALSLAHGVALIAVIHGVGSLQAVFSPALAQAVVRHGATEEAPVRLRPAPDAKAYIFHRLTTDIRTYHGVPIGARVNIVSDGDAADYVIESDGRLTPIAAPSPLPGAIPARN